MSGIDFYCTHCDFRCDRQSTLNRHKRTPKHKKLSSSDYDPTNTSKKYTCICGKNYKYRQGLFTHKEKCSYKEKSIENCSNEKNIDYKELYYELKAQVEQFNIILEKHSNIINNS